MAKKKKRTEPAKPVLRPVGESDYQDDPHGYWGGHLRDFPQPVAWYWPKGKHKRLVRCQISSWVGLGVGASHYHAAVTEDDNVAWNGERWARPWDSEERGKSFSKACLIETKAIAYINSILRRHFPKDRYELSSVHVNEPPPNAKYLMYSGD